MKLEIYPKETHWKYNVLTDTLTRKVTIGNLLHMNHIYQHKK